MEIIQKLEEATIKRDVHFRPGDTVKVHVRIKEGDKERIQIFQGVVIALNRGGHKGARTSFTVRKMSDGVGVERVFPLQSPWIEKIETTFSGKVRRAKLYYLRGLRGKKARLKERGSYTIASKTKAAAKN